MVAFTESLDKIASDLIASNQEPDDGEELRHLSGSSHSGPLTEEEKLDELAHTELLKTELVIFMLFCGLILGMIIKLVTKKLKLPYTPFLTLAGVAVGEIDR